MQRRSSRLANQPVKSYRSNSDDFEQSTQDYYTPMENTVQSTMIQKNHKPICNTRIMMFIATFMTVVFILMFPLNVNANIVLTPNMFRKSIYLSQSNNQPFTTQYETLSK